MERAALLATGLLVLAACGGDGVSVEGAWSRTNPLTETPGVVYFDLTVPDDDRLVGAEVPASVADHAEIHEVVAADSAGDSTPADTDDTADMDDIDMSEGSRGSEDDDHDMGSMMTMQEMTDGLALAGGETVAFEPGGYHVMLMDLAAPLEAGDEFELILTFERADPVEVTVEVADDAP